MVKTIYFFFFLTLGISQTDYTVPQSTEQTYYYFNEVTLDGNSDKNLTIAYNATTRTGVATRMVDAADNQLFRWWWIPS